MKISFAKDSTEFVAFAGGLSLSGPPLFRKQGTLEGCLNYVPNINGGYSRIKGYERFSGKLAPSEARYYLIGATLTSTPAALAALTMGAQTATFIREYAPGVILVAELTAAVTNGASIMVGATNVGTVTAPVASVSITAELDAQLQLECAEVRRALIAKPTGAGPVRGVALYNGKVYCWRDNVGQTAGQMFVSSAGGWTAVSLGAVTLPPGGHYRWIVENFFGQATTRRLYFANGVGKACEFDGTTLVAITTGAAVDTPSYIASHAQRLILAQGSSIMWSVAGQPTTFSGTLGSYEFAMGDTVTGMEPIAGNTLAVATLSTVRGMIGTPSSGMDMQTLSKVDGALPHMAVLAGDLFALNETSLTSFYATQKFGSFEADGVDDAFKPARKKISTQPRASVAVNGSNQIRFMGADGSGLVCLVRGAKIAAATLIQYLFSPSCISAGIDTDGSERVFAGGDDGYVYELDRGATFDGADIEAYIKLNYMSSRSPRGDKTYFDGYVEMEAERYAPLACLPDFNYGSPDVREAVAQQLIVIGAGGRWDIAEWDNFFWDAATVTSPKFKIRGSGKNLSLTFYSKTKLDPGHTLQGVTLRYAMRKLSKV